MDEKKSKEVKKKGDAAPSQVEAPKPELVPKVHPDAILPKPALEKAVSQDEIQYESLKQFGWDET